jgi:hypothetical protein
MSSIRDDRVLSSALDGKAGVADMAVAAGVENFCKGRLSGH